MKSISVLGSTGSIGTQTLEVAGNLGIYPAALTAGTNVKMLESQCREFKPKLAVLYDEDAARDLKTRIADLPVRVSSGTEGLVEAASLEKVDTVVTAVVGMIGLKPTIAAIKEGKRVALANKETLVCAGELVMSLAAKHNAEIIPVDSEHSAIFQCLNSGRVQEIKRLILTASGGPFFGKTRKELGSVTLDDALRHPNWSMGAKITIDSATLMNKGLEYIEAMYLYDMQPEKIDILVHPESIIHSMVEYCDGAVIAQMSKPDMRLPIQYALTYPERMESPVETLDFVAARRLTFAEPDMEAFGCLSAALEAVRMGGAACAALNGGNEAAVELFLKGKIPFLRIEELVKMALQEYTRAGTGLEDILYADRRAREVVLGA